MQGYPGEASITAMPWGEHHADDSRHELQLPAQWCPLAACKFTNDRAQVLHLSVSQAPNGNCKVSGFNMKFLAMLEG